MENAIEKLQKIPEPECSQFIADNRNTAAYSWNEYWKIYKNLKLGIDINLVCDNISHIRDFVMYLNSITAHFGGRTE